MAPNSIGGLPPLEALPFDPMTIIFIIVAFAGMYFLMLRPASRRAKEQQDTLSAIQPGTRVMLTAGIFGTVSHVGDKQLVVELAPGCEITVMKQAIAKVTTADDEEFEFEGETPALSSEPSAAVTPPSGLTSAPHIEGESTPTDPDAVTVVADPRDTQREN